MLTSGRQKDLLRLTLPPRSNLLRKYVRHMERLLPLPEHAGSDTLIPRYRIIPLMFRQVKHGGRPEIMEVLSQFTKAKIVKKNWPLGAPQAESRKGGTTSDRYS